MAFQGLMRAFLGVLNIIFFLIGSATLSIGIWVKVDKKHLLDLTKDVSGADLGETDIPSLLENAVVVLIVSGSFIFLLGFLGGLGTIQNKSKGGKLCLKIYSTIVLIVLVLEIAAVTVAWLFFDKLETKMKEYLDASLKYRYNGTFTVPSSGVGFAYSSGGDAITLAWDIVQLQYSCCGRSNGTDYNANRGLIWNDYRSVTQQDGSVREMMVPPTCCAVNDGSKALIADLKKVSAAEFTLTDDQCPYDPVDDNVEGCYEELKDIIKANSVIFIAVGGTTLLIELMCIVFACCLAKRDNDEVNALKNDISS